MDGWRYQGGGYYHGVPARDLTVEEYEALGDEGRHVVRAGTRAGGARMYLPEGRALALERGMTDEASVAARGRRRDEEANT